MSFQLNILIAGFTVPKMVNNNKVQNIFRKSVLVEKTTLKKHVLFSFYLRNSQD